MQPTRFGRMRGLRFWLVCPWKLCPAGFLDR